MPSQAHEMLLLPFRNRPALAPELLREALNVELPEYSEARLESAELNDVVPTEYRADLVVLLVNGKPVLGIVVEVQLQPDARKRFSWPVYVTGLRARLECPCCLLVVTTSDSTGDVETAVKIAHNAFSSTASLDEDTRVLYFDLIDTALGEAARKALQMLPRNYEFQGPTFKKGQLQGQTTAMASATLEILDARGLNASDEVRERVQNSTDLDQLRRWVRRAAVITRAEDLFDE